MVAGTDGNVGENAVQPDVTVIVAVYNCEAYVGECLESLRSQTRGDFECIVVDDASTDDSVEAVRAQIADDGRFTLIEKAENGGPGAARNEALGCARGRYVMYVDADDRLHVSMIEKLARCLNENRADAAMCGFVDYPHGAPVKKGLFS